MRKFHHIKKCIPAFADAGDAESSKRTKSIRSRRCLLPSYRKTEPIGTSDVAAISIASRTPIQCSLVYAANRNAGAWGLTDEDEQVFSGDNVQSYTPRRRKLAIAGLIRDTGERRKTVSGCDAAVWVAVSKRGDSTDA